MALSTFQAFYANFNDQLRTWDTIDLKSYDVYTNGNRKIGSVRDVLVDDTGHFRYLIIDLCSWGQSKAILLPIGLACFNYDQGHAFVDGLSPTQLEKLPGYYDGQDIDRGYEQKVRDAFRPIASRRAGRRFLQHPYTVNGRYQGAPSGYTPSTAQDYDHNPTFYGMSDRDNQRPLKHLENRLTQ